MFNAKILLKIFQHCGSSLHFAVILFPILLGMQTNLCAQNDDCRLKLDELKPVIQRFNPFFSHHKWNLNKRLEMARMGAHRLLIISQSGCKRHHFNFNLLIDNDIVQQTDSFWINEVKSLMHKIYFEQSEYDLYRATFEETFEEKYRMYGLGGSFNFPLGTRNFICQLRYDEEKGGQVAIEMVQYLFKDKVEVKRKGIPAEKDDGWLGKDKP